MLGRLLDRSESRAVQATAWGDWGDTGRTWSGNDVTAKSSLQLLTVYGCNRFICDGISTLPVDTFRTTTPAIIEEPAPGVDFISWATQFLTSLLLAGDFFGWRVYQGSTLAGVLPLDPGAVDVYRENGRKRFRVNGADVDPFNVMHVTGIMWPGSDRGLSPVEYARQGIGMGMAAQEYGARFFDQDSTPSGVIEVPGELEPTKAREMARSWQKKHAGKGKVGLPGVLQGGAVWKATAVNNEQAQFLETRQFTAAEIAAEMFLIDPPEMGIGVQGQSLTYTNQEQRNTRKVQVTFLPWIVRLERALTSMLPPGPPVKLNVNGLLRGDTKTRFETYKIGLDTGVLEPDEVRALEDLPPLPSKPASPPSLTEQIEAVGQLIRAGFEPAAALTFLGLPPIQHTGLVPITVTPEVEPNA